ncbi:MAG: fasciclin domain-containing protein [Patescibacteria group bacterium]
MKKFHRVSRRQREWIWALVAIGVAVVAIWWYALLAPYQYNPVPVTTLDTSSAVGSQAAKPADSSVVGILASIPEGSTFNSYFVADKIASLLGKGPYTIFVPTNSAIAALPAGTISGLSATAQKRLLEYHVVSGRMLDTDAIASGNFQALSRDILNFSTNLTTGATYVNSGKVLKAYKASNGIIYVINAVLLPPR